MRRRVDAMAAEGKANPRQIIWDAVRAAADAGRTIDLGSITERTQLNRKTVADYLLSLERAGFLAPIEGASKNWGLARDGGVHAPRVRLDGSMVTQGAGMQNLWRSMRMMSKFSALDLALHSSTPSCSVAEATAQSYITMLLSTGFLAVVQKADPVKGRKAIYRLIRNDGPKPPQVQRVKQIYDPNTGKIYRKAEAS